jgi:hypothetical protein
MYEEARRASSARSTPHRTPDRDLPPRAAAAPATAPLPRFSIADIDVHPAGGAPVQRVCSVAGCGDPRGHETLQHVLNHAREVEILARGQVPRAANQAVDLDAGDPDVLARFEHARMMNRSVLRPGVLAPQAENDPPQQPLNTLATAMAAERYRGGMCNEYSALAFAHHMASPAVSQWPIVRYWNSELGHSFTTVGDARDPARPQVVSDPWTIDRDPVLPEESNMHGGTNSVVATWADRMPGEGRQAVDQARAATAGLFNQAEAGPLGAQLNAEGQRQRNAQAEMLRIGARPSWVYDYRTNRR